MKLNMIDSTAQRLPLMRELASEARLRERIDYPSADAVGTSPDKGRQGSVARRVAMFALTLVLMLSVLVPALTVDANATFREIITGHNGAEFVYELLLTDQNGATVTNPRKMKAGDTLNVEIRLTREGYNSPNYDSYGIEFRLLTRGLTYNYDGATLRNGTQVHMATYMDGDSVGFAWYDMTRQGESFANPVLAASWSYTVDNPKAVNITVPVALIYITGEDDEFVPVGTARLYLDLNGGELIGEDVSGEYPSGKAVVLPDAKFADYVFDGWSDGVRVYPAGTEYIVSGVVTLTAQWSGLVRDRYVQLVYDGGALIGEDISGYYADDEVIVLPDATREGYRLVGWSDGVNTYKPGDKYVVYNTVNLTAQWEEIHDCGWVAPVLIGVIGLGLLLLLLLLWKRKTVKYSLVNGDVALDYKNGDKPVQIDVMLISGDTEYHLARSEIVEAKQRLRFIPNVANVPVADIEEGTYKGKLLIYDGSETKVKDCRIKALDKELDEPSN